MTTDLHEDCSPTVPPAQRSDAYSEFTDAPPLTMEDRLLAWVDVWMAEHPIASSIVAVTSTAAFVTIVAFAVTYSIH